MKKICKKEWQQLSPNFSSKDLFIKNRTIHSSKTLLSVVWFFMNKSLLEFLLCKTCLPFISLVQTVIQLFIIQIKKGGKILLPNQVKSKIEAFYSKQILPNFAHLKKMLTSICSWSHFLSETCKVRCANSFWYFAKRFRKGWRRFPLLPPLVLLLDMFAKRQATKWLIWILPVRLKI